VIPLIAVVLCVWWYNPMGGTDMVATLPWRQKSSDRNRNSSVADNDNSAWKRTSPSTHGATTRTSGGDSRDPAEFACVWKPHEDDACLDRLPRQITTSLRNGPPLNQRRWLFLGDSTMFQLFKVSPLLEYLLVNAPSKHRVHSMRVARYGPDRATPMNNFKYHDRNNGCGPIIPEPKVPYTTAWSILFAAIAMVATRYY
jgi:hypothetical protein